MAQGDKNLEILINIVTQELGQQKADEILKKYTAATEDSTKETHKHTEAHRELHRIFHQLNEIVPGLGNQMTRLFSKYNISPAMLLSLTAVATALTILHKKYEEVEEKARKAWIAADEGAKKATAAANEYADQMEIVNKAIQDERVSQRYDHDKAVLDAMVLQWKVMLDLQEKLAMAAAGDDATKQAAVKKRFEEIKGQSSLNTEERELNLRRNELFDKELKRDEAKTKSTTASGNLSDLLAQPPEGASDLDKLKEKLLKTTQRYTRGQFTDPEKAIEYLGKEQERFKGGPGENVYQKEILELDTKLKQIQTIEQHNLAVAEATKKAQTLTAEFTALEKEVSALHKTVGTSAEVLGIHRTTELRTERGDRAAQIIAEGEAIAKKYDRHKVGHGLAPGEEEFMRNTASFYMQQKQTTESALKVYAALQKHPEQQKAVLDRMLTLLEGLDRAYEPFNKRLQSLEAKFNANPPHP